MSASPDLSILVASYNTRTLLDECLQSLTAALRMHSYEVIVADNASVDGSVEMLRTHWPAVQVIEMGENLGFARATNRAMAQARGRYHLLLNSDTVCLDRSLDSLVDFLEATPAAGVAAPQLLNADLTDQGTARAFPTVAAAIFGRKSMLSRLFPGNPWTRGYLVGRSRSGDSPFQVDWVSGACLMVRREAVDQVGPLDEGFFMQWEDADWCRRMGQSDWVVFCVPSAQVVHYEGQSERMYGGFDRGRRHGRPPRLEWEFHRSAYRYFAKHHAPQPWNPLRPAAAVVLAGRAAVCIGKNGIANLAMSRAGLGSARAQAKR